MRKKIYKLTGLKLGEGKLILDRPIKEIGIGRKMEWVRQLHELQSDPEILADSLEETKVTGKG